MFRVFSKERNSFVYSDDYDVEFIFSRNGGLQVFDNSSIHGPNIIAHEGLDICTGLIDSDGLKIFQNDIVAWKDKYLSNSFRATVKYGYYEINGELRIGFYHLIHDEIFEIVFPDNIKIIGNVYTDELKGVDWE